MKQVFLICLSLWSLSHVMSQEVRSLIQSGNQAYSEGAYELADSSYQAALDQAPENFEGAFNRADALYRQQKYEEAAGAFRQLTSATKDPVRKANAYHNLGNSLLKEQKLEESIEAYKNALRSNPQDADARYNLALAQRMLKEQQKQEEENKDQENKDENEEKEENKDQENKDEEGKDKSEDGEKNDQEKENQDQQESKDSSEEENKKQGEDQKQQESKPGDEQSQEAKPAQLSPQEAERMLEAMEQQERNTQQLLMKKKGKGKPVKIEKDW